MAVGPLMLQSFLFNASNLVYLQYSRYCTELYFFVALVPEVLHQTLNNYITYCTLTKQILGRNSCVKGLKRSSKFGFDVII